MHVLVQVAHQLALIAGIGVGMALVHHDLLRRPIAGGAGQGLDVEGHAVDHHGLPLGAGQHTLPYKALRAVVMRARALLDAAYQDGRHGIAGFAVGVDAFDLFLATDQSRYCAITGIGMLMTGVLRHLTDQGLFHFIAAIRVVVRPLFLQTAHQVAVSILAVLVVSVVILALHDAADQLAAGIATGVRVLVGREMARVDTRFFHNRRALLLAAGQHIRVAGVGVLVGFQAANQRGGLALAGFGQGQRQVGRNQQHHRQHQRQHTPRAVGKSPLIHGATEFIFHVFFLQR